MSETYTDVELDPPATEDGVSVEVTEDGGAVIDFRPDEKETQVDTDGIPFNANLADHIEEAELNKIGQDVCAKVQIDDDSRKEWMETYKKGLELLGLTIEERTVPWPNACGVFHPVMTEAVVRFQAQAMMEFWPPKGPVKTAVLGKSNPDLDAQARRVKDDMNYILTEKMEGYYEDTEQLLLNLPLVGSCFRKGYGDAVKQRPESQFVPAEDFIMPFTAVSLYRAERYTHRFAISLNEILKYQFGGAYKMGVTTARADREADEVKEAKDKIQGQEPEEVFNDDRVFFEQHTVYDLPAPFNDPDGIARPYIITVDKATQHVLAIYRNWKEEDPLKMRRMWFSEYKFLPGMGSYGWGLIHVIGGLTKAATSILRQLVDAGTVSNLPGGYKTKNMRIKGDNTPVQPGEWRDVDITGMKLADSFFPLPYKEPSRTLYELLLNIIDEARRVGSVADTKISDMSANMPVGTTFALLERSLKVQSAVQARMHKSAKAEFRILAEIIPEDMPPEYPFDVGGPFTRTEDYDARVDVIPVSDPNASTTAQRILQGQAALQMAETEPQIYDMRELHTKMLTAMNVDDAERIIPPPPEIKPRDPVTENMDLMTNKPVKAGMEQDHEAHIAVHKAILDDPKIGEMVQNTPQGPAIAAAAAAHIQEHLAFKYRRDIEKAMGVPLPPPGEPLPADVEVQLSQLTAEAADQVLARSQAEQQREEVAEKMQDPVIQNQQRELDLKGAEVERKARADDLRAEQADKDREAKLLTDVRRMQTDILQTVLQLGGDDAERETKEKINKEQVAVKIGEILRRGMGVKEQ